MRAFEIAVRLGLLAILGRLFWVQVLCHPEYAERAARQQERRVSVEAVRGEIVDRDGRVLTRTLTAQALVARPSEVGDCAAAARRLAPILGRQEAELRRLIGRRSVLVEIDDRLSVLQADQVRALRLGGIRIEEAGRRVGLVEGCDLIGALDAGGAGVEGIERSMDQFLRGESGWKTLSVDARGRLTPRLGSRERPAADGCRVVLTIDSRLQWMVEDALARAVAAHGARGGSAVVVELPSGEVLALASAGAAARGSRRRAPRLAAIEDTYEPGSTFKPITFAAALDGGLIDDDTHFDAEEGRADLGGFVIRDVKKMGWLCAADVLAQSSNIATAKLGQMLGAGALYEAARRFGLGRPTDIELPGEEGGLLWPFERWSGRSSATVAIGQEVAVTTLQLAMVYAALGSDGQLLRPHLVREVVAPNGEIRLSTRREVVRRATTPETARTVRRYLERAVEVGTGKRAAVPGVRVAGKTGTAQKARTEGRGYAHGAYVSSFIGMMPADEPRLVIAVSIDEPRGAHYGGEVAAPVFSEIARTASGPGSRPDGMRLVGGPELARTAAAASAAAAGGPAPPPEAIPDLRGLALREALRRLQGAEVDVRAAGTGRIVEQHPPAGTPVTPGLVCRLTLDGGGHEVPARLTGARSGSP